MRTFKKLLVIINLEETTDNKNYTGTNCFDNYKKFNIEELIFMILNLH